MSTLTPEWVNKLTNEIGDLEGKIDKLAKFLATEKFKQLSLTQQGLLVEQLSAMWTYHYILIKRIGEYRNEKGETK